MSFPLQISDSMEQAHIELSIIEEKNKESRTRVLNYLWGIFQLILKLSECKLKSNNKRISRFRLESKTNIKKD